MTYTKEFLISEIQRFYKENGRSPKIKEMKVSNGYPHERIFYKKFGTFNKALEASDLKLNSYQDHWKNGTEICSNCGKKSIRWYYDENKNRYCSSCIRKQDYKYGNLNPESAIGFAFISQRIVAKTLNINHDCNLEINFGHPYDLYDINYGKIDVKCSKLLLNEGIWEIWSFKVDKKNKADYYIMLGFSRDKKEILKSWIIPTNTEILNNKKSINIYNSEKGLLRFKEFEVDHKSFNTTYHSMSIDNCPVLRKI